MSDENTVLDLKTEREARQDDVSTPPHLPHTSSATCEQQPSELYKKLEIIKDIRYVNLFPVKLDWPINLLNHKD
jgi:hypothetical protein